MISIFDAAALVAAGTVAGLVGSAGGITSLVSYPALLAVGLPAFSANVVNNVAVVACLPGSAAASQPELEGTGSWLARWTLVTAAGGAAGAVLLLVTPSQTFSRIVPFLVAAGSVALLAEPRLRSWRAGRAGAGNRFVLPLVLVALAGYNGYFGAGSGVMTLTLMLVLVDRRLPTANALKNVLIGASSVIAAALFAATGSVDWAAAAPTAAGMLIGSSLGPRLARRLPATLLRLLIVVFGLTLAVRLWLHPGA